MTTKAFRNLSDAELELVAGGTAMSVVPSLQEQVGGTRDGGAGSDAGPGGGSNLDVLQETQPEIN